jgi:hypothetical protein
MPVLAQFETHLCWVPSLDGCAGFVPISTRRLLTCARTPVSEGELPVLTRISYIVDAGVPPEVPPVFRKKSSWNRARSFARKPGVVEGTVSWRPGATWAKCALRARQQWGAGGRRDRRYRALRRTFRGGLCRWPAASSPPGHLRGESLEPLRALGIRFRR